MRRAVVSTLVAICVAAIAPTSAAGLNRQYQVLKCHVFAPTSSEVQLQADGAYRTVDACGTPDQRFELTIDGFGLPGQAASIRLQAPDNTTIVGVIVDANLRRENHHLAQLGIVEPSGTPKVLANGDDSGSGFQNYTFSGLNATYFVAQLVCSDPGGCPNSAVAHAYVKNIALVLEDRADPGITFVRGSLLDAGWLRGDRDLQAQAADLGSGVSSLWVVANGTEIARVTPPCVGGLAPAVASTLTPCAVFPSSSNLNTLLLNTASAPFANGENIVQLCAADFAGNGPTCEAHRVLLDNEAPTASFLAPQDPSDPELVRVAASDLDSGLDVSTAQISYRAVGSEDWIPLPTQIQGGALTARVDSEGASPGEYEFIATIGDLAGNRSTTSVRADGSPMRLIFPLREPVQLTAAVGHDTTERQTIAYRDGTNAHGRLLDSKGEPLAGRQVTVSEHFGSGALIDQRVRTVTTNTKGRWRSAIPAGPSRLVTVSFAGTARYRPSMGQSSSLEVRSRATFEISRDRVLEGTSVRFHGKVGHFGARIPQAGKLIELQVRERRGRWNTVGQAFHTNGSGRYHVSYRFGRFYESNARFVFRVKIAREQGWPYKAPAQSPSQGVTVVANQ